MTKPSASPTDQFYAELPLHSLGMSELLQDQGNFTQVPPDWHVVITDIKGSTKAVGAGHHDQVNLVATGCIIATLNLARKHTTSIPFFFGGDGATLIVPPNLLEAVVQALTEHKANTLDQFDLDLRVGHMGLAEVYNAGYELRIAKAKVTPMLEIPVVIGSGLHYVEKIIKQRDPAPPVDESRDPLLDLEGMECRWDRIRPPEEMNEVVSLLVDARQLDQQAEVFKIVLDHLDNIYGPLQQRQPISTKKLKLNTGFGKIRNEMRSKLGKSQLSYLLTVWLQTMFGRFFYFVFDPSGRRYLSSLVQLSDTFVLDGRINTVISGTADQRKQLISALDEMESEGTIHYGIYASDSSVMSCYVRNRENLHIHFVDGAEGGYTQAAKMLKSKRPSPA